MQLEQNIRRRSRLVLPIFPIRVGFELGAVQALWRSCTPISGRKGRVKHLSRSCSLLFKEVCGRRNHRQILSKNATYVPKHGYERERLWRPSVENSMRCGDFFSDNWLKSMYAEDLLPAIQQHVRHHVSTNLKLESSEVVNFTQGCSQAQNGNASLQYAVSNYAVSQS